MKQTILIWRDPNGSLIKEQFDYEEVKIRTDGPLLKLIKKDSGEIIRMIPVHKVELIEFVEKKEEPRIVMPGMGAGLPKTFEVS